MDKNLEGFALFGNQPLNWNQVEMEVVRFDALDGSDHWFTVMEKDGDVVSGAVHDTLQSAIDEMDSYQKRG